MNLTYDANGNLISDSTGRQFTWNAQDQLAQVQFPTLSALIGYDPLGRRTSFSKGSNNKTFFYLGQSMLSDGSARFLHGVGIDQPLQLDTSLGSQSYLQDHLGSTSQLVDSLNGNSKTRYDYKSYGKLEGDIANPQASNSFTYTGREDDGTGLLYYRARYYDPELEMFISQDPLGDAQRYVGGNPIRAIDPWGLYTLNIIISSGYGPAEWVSSINRSSLIDATIKDSSTVYVNEGINVKSSLTTAINNHKGELPTDLNIFSHGLSLSLGSGNHDIDSINRADIFSPLLKNGNKAAVNITLYACNTAYGSNNITKWLSESITSGNVIPIPLNKGIW